MIWTLPPQKEPQITVTARSQNTLLQDLRQHLQAGHGFSVATLNLDHVVKLRSDSAFLEAYSAQTHVTADGRPVVWLSRYAGQQVDLITGSDLLEPMLALCADLAVPVAFFGSTEDVLTEAAMRLEARHPGLRVVAKIAPPMGFDPTSPAADAQLAQIAKSDARICLIALGAPKQEILAARGQSKYPSMGFLSIGASLDFVAGKEIRAPRIVRAMAAEWLWRMLQDPRRLVARYAACLAILPSLVLRATRLRYSSRDRSRTS